MLEGPDRSGKSTLIAGLNKSGKYINKRYPNRTSKTGELLNSYLQTPNLNPASIHLIFAANRWEDNDTVLQLLLNGNDVLVDRYSYSGISYSIAKGLDKSFCTNTETGLIKPDLVLFMDIGIDVCGKREGYGQEAFENLEFQKSVREAYQECWDKSVFRKIDATKEKEDVLEQAERIIKATRAEGVNEIRYLE